MCHEISLWWQERRLPSGNKTVTKDAFMEKIKVLREIIGEHVLLEDIMNGKGYLMAYVPDW